MATSLRSASAPFANSAATTSLTMTGPATVSAGDALALIVIASAGQGDAVSSVAPPSGFALSGSFYVPSTSTAEQPAVGAYLKAATSADAAGSQSYTVGCDNSTYGYTLLMLAVAGASGSAAVTPTGGFSSTAGTSISAPTINGTSGDMLVTVHSQATTSGSATTCSTPTGMTAAGTFVSTTYYPRGVVAYQVLSATGATGAKAATSSLSKIWSALSFTLAAGSAVVAAPPRPVRSARQAVSRSYTW